MKDFIRREYMSVSAKREQGCPDNCTATETPDSLWFKSLSDSVLQPETNGSSLFGVFTVATPCTFTENLGTTRTADSG